MPYSSLLGKESTLNWFQKNSDSINSVLDIGVGSGTYVKLIKPFLPHIVWTGIEAWEPYVNKFNLNNLYNTLHVLDVRKFQWHNRYDVVIAGDVLEHLTKEEAVELVNQILLNSNYLIISIPISFYPQDEYEGNPYEKHVKPDWTHSEFMESFGKFVVSSEVFEEPNLKLGVYWLKQ